MKKSSVREGLMGYAFILPTFIGFCVFMVYPLCYSFFLSFYDWEMMKGFAGSTFIGLENYVEAVQDIYFTTALANNLKLLLIAVPILLFLALVLACVLNTAIFGRGALRTVYFLPYITTVTAAAVVFGALFHEELGPINQFLRTIGIENPPNWLGSVQWAMVSVGIFWVWRMLGYCMIIFLSGLQGISRSYYEAASIDGASGLQRFRYITFPLISPTTFFLAITMGIFSFAIFAEVNVLTGGGPGMASYTLVYMIYQQAFTFYKMGYASAVGVIYFCMILVITLIQWIGQKKWVNY